MGKQGASISNYNSPANSQEGSISEIELETHFKVWKTSTKVSVM